MTSLKSADLSPVSWMSVAWYDLILSTAYVLLKEQKLVDEIVILSSSVVNKIILV